MPDKEPPKPISNNHPAIPKDWFLEQVAYQSRFTRNSEDEPTELPCGVCAGRHAVMVFELNLDSQHHRREHTVEVYCRDCQVYSVYVYPDY